MTIFDDEGDGDETGGADLDWDLEDRDRFMAEADDNYVAPVDEILGADE